MDTLSGLLIDSLIENPDWTVPDNRKAKIVKLIISYVSLFKTSKKHTQKFILIYCYFELVGQHNIFDLKCIQNVPFLITRF